MRKNLVLAGAFALSAALGGLALAQDDSDSASSTVATPVATTAPDAGNSSDASTSSDSSATTAATATPAADQ